MRIEDIVLNTLISNREEVFFKNDYQTRLHSNIITTGNELTNQEVVEFSNLIDKNALFQYAKEVYQTTNEYLEKLTYDELKHRFTNIDKDRITNLCVVSTEDTANWLIDYWYNKDIKGLLKMPFSRHYIMHIEAANKIRSKVQQ